MPRLRLRQTLYSTCYTVIRWGGPQQLTQSESGALALQDRRRVLPAVHLFLFCAAQGVEQVRDTCTVKV